VSKKEELLRKLSNAELLELVNSQTRASVDSETPRPNLIRILKGALSVEEIKRKGRGFETTYHVRARRKNQFLAVLVISLVAYGCLFIESALTLNNVNPKETSVEENWNRNYDLREYSVGSVDGTLDGGYIMIGWNYDGNYVSSYLLKTDSAGNVQWRSPITEQTASCVDQTPDGGFLIGGTNFTVARSYNSWIVKTDSSGSVQWSKDHLEIGNFTVYSIHQTSDNGYIIAGATLVYPSLISWAAKIDQNWTVLWNAAFGYGYAFDAQETPEGGYIVAVSVSAGVLLTKRDSNGQEQWSRPLQKENGALSGVCLEQTSDEGFVIAGSAVSFESGTEEDFWIGRTDADGKMLWNRTYGVSSINQARWVQQTSDGGYILAGITYPGWSIMYPRNVLLVKADPNGNLQWESVYRRGGDNDVLFVQQRPSGGYLVAGASLINQTCWLVEVTPGSPSALLVEIPVILVFSGLIVATCLLLMARRLKRSGQKSPTYDEIDGSN
jgi:hypothetical protein